MAELKTRPGPTDPTVFINTLSDEQRRSDCLALIAMLQEITGAPAELWGADIVGFGRYAYRYASGHTGEWMVIGFSPRKQYLTLYIMSGFDQYEDLLSRLGKHKTGKSCLYVNKLADLDQSVLRELAARSVAHMRATNPPSAGK
ncbi:MAG: DUF1801 domain-containing protein [Anaerolineae bacterium]|nr:DUF1801 domain-containing protein [Anaerolineae bacterium]